ncbi:response regulator transcription factor [Pelagicoccus sp. NFK12]|uniref:Response regulator transcription factor n=1 Tax=Pelagicoccus enzymogenes TaxID=2773457 RepID=A0A927FF18_9BACT|nr:response regulator transcription factor [Pelagicoccus enzymogenes]MBD5782208.1 response regulator transcription factor [Pelagicoccus enzymogenes]
MSENSKIRVMLVDDHPSMLMGMVSIVESQPDMEVAGKAESGEAALELFKVTRPDVILMDLRMPGNMSGVEAIMSICRIDSSAKVIVFSTFDCDEDIHLALQSGAKSYLLKDMSIAEICGAIRRVQAGEQVLPEFIANRLSESSPRQALTEREREVLEALLKGRSNKEIAHSLYISIDTVKTHLKTLFAKLEVQDRTEAAVTAIRRGIVHLD